MTDNPPEPSATSTTDGAGRIRVVIAEDEAIIRLDLKETLAGRGLPRRGRHAVAATPRSRWSAN